MKKNTHHKGASLRPVKKFKYGSSSIPMTKPRRSKKVHGRRGGLRG